jgi:hypothetical protein
MPPDPLEEELCGPLRYCRKCGEWWPDDAEFFFIDPKTGHGLPPCKACREESRDALLQRPCIEPGCPNPRYHTHDPRCLDHAKALRRKKLLERKQCLKDSAKKT